MKNNNLIFNFLACSAVLTLSATLVAHAADLKAPFEMESTATLPKKVRNPRFKNVTFGIEKKYSGNATVEALGAKLNKQVLFSDVVDGQPDALSRAAAEGLVKDAGLGRGQSPGATRGAVTVSGLVMAPVLAYGVTDSWTLAVAAPIMKLEAKTATGFEISEEGKQFIRAAAKVSPNRGQEVSEKLNQAINGKLERMGYEPIKDQKVTALGDVKLVSKVKFYENEIQALSLKNDVTIPTGKPMNINRVVDLPTGDGQWDLGAGLVHDTKLSHAWRFTNSVGYNWQLADRVERRIPNSATDSLSSDKEVLDRNLGDQIMAGTGLSYYWVKTGLTFGAGYNFQYQNKTSYSGDRFSKERYSFLEGEFPRQQLQSVLGSLGFSTVDFFKRKAFPLPLQTNLTYSAPLEGYNVTKNSMIQGELVLFF